MPLKSIASGRTCHQKLSFLQLFFCADRKDKLFTAFGILFSMGVGAVSPLNVLVFQRVINSFVSRQFTPDDIRPFIVQFLYLGGIMFTLSFFQNVLLDLSSKRQRNRMRLLYFHTILRKTLVWLSHHPPGKLISQLSEEIDHIELAIGTRLGDFVHCACNLIVGIIVAFTVGWKLSLVAAATLPLAAAVFTTSSILIRYFSTKESQAYAQASAIASEVLSAIHTVVAFGGEQKELMRYSNKLGNAERVGIKRSLAASGVMGSIGFLSFTAAALIFWYGVKLIGEKTCTSGAVVTVFVNIVLGCVYFGKCLPHFQLFSQALSAAQEIYDTTECISTANTESCGSLPPTFSDKIVFHNLNFSYPTRPDVIVLKDLNMTIKVGQTVALVGPSGSGKSTVVYLLQKLYDPLKGQITVDGRDLKELDVKAFRSQLGCVLQEPALFRGTVADNIRFGKLNATEEEVVEAAKKANAHEFIMKLPEGYDTVLTGRKGGISEGQKQRIAIARALIRKPKLLLLDKAISALDARSEQIVHATLDKVSEGCTVLVVAHRLASIRNADWIIVLDRGSIREQGTHDQLLALNGLYATMWFNQEQLMQTEEPVDEDDENLSEFEDFPEMAGRIKKTSSVTLRKEVGTNCRSVESDLSFSSMPDENGDTHRSPVAEVLEMNKPEIGYILGGCFCSLVSGGVQPTFAVMLAGVYQIFTLENQPALMQEKMRLVSGMMALAGFVRLVASLGAGYFFGVSGERLTRRTRAKYFESMLRQGIAWFDQLEHQSGALVAQLATQVPHLKVLSGLQLGLIVEATTLLILSMALSFNASWQLTLLFFLFMPFVVLGGFLQARTLSGVVRTADSTLTMQIAQEVIQSYRTVAVFGLEAHFYKLFALSLKSNKNVLSVMNLGSLAMGHIMGLIPEIVNAAKIAKSVLTTFHRIPEIQPDKGIVPNRSFSGQVRFSHIYFRYPTRKEVLVIKNFNYLIKPGETVVLVGQSGCGKSTLLQMILRFYDPLYRGPASGIFFDDYNLRDLSPRWIRSQIGVVRHEPNLFNLSIKDNITYGIADGAAVSMEEIIEVARLANIHDFINSLPEGYDTMVGLRGSQLSVGQKQRIAIARALLRKPVLLLLDEATANLDVEDERVVQSAVETAAMSSRTILLTTHHLNTTQLPDKILLIKNGRVTEVGSTTSALENRGASSRGYMEIEVQSAQSTDLPTTHSDSLS
ncbi:unnamed protein product [Calicophoron daubneyi]|uniref:Uncharacterized protein n=1 Tax=Calicophoron daubneyi TaxID=300641 RepID=A0AAV2T4K7_CALDB